MQCDRSSMVEPLPSKQKTTSSILAGRSARVAQLVEHRFCKARVAGSSPASGTA